MAKSLLDFRNFVLSKYPRMPANQKDALDSFVKQKLAEQITGGGVPITDIPTDLSLAGVMAGQVQAGTYQPGGSAAKPAAKDVALAQSGIQNLNDVRKIYKDDPNVLTKQLLPGQYLSRKFDSATYDMADTLLRLRTGAQANPTEIRGYMKKIAPSFGDSPDVVEYKLTKLERDLQAYMGKQPTKSTKVGKYTIEAIE